MSMNFEIQAFRKDTADTLRSMSKEERLDHLAFLKMNDREYNIAYFSHSVEVNAKIMAERVSAITHASESLADLKQHLAEEEVLIGNDVSGTDHSEHLVKRVQLAEATGCVLLVPEDGGLAKKVEDLFVTEGIKRKEYVDNVAYQAFLKNRFPDVEFSEDEWQGIVKKLPAQVFGSVDVAMERLTLLLNAVDDTTTRFSCSGHTERSNKFVTVERYLDHAYVAFKANEELANRFQKEFEGEGPATVGVEGAGESSYVLRFRQTPPEAWILENGKRTPAQIRSDCREALMRDFQVTVPAGIASVQYFSMLRKVQAAHVEKTPQVALRQRPNTNIFRDMLKYYPEEVMAWEYADYLQSDAAKLVRDDFIHRAENVAEQYRSTHKK